MSEVTVEKLRQKGYKVRVTHVRDTIVCDENWNWLFSRYEYEEKLKEGKLEFPLRPYQVTYSKKYGDVVLPHGGFTHVEVTTPGIPENTRTIAIPKPVRRPAIASITLAVPCNIPNQPLFTSSKKPE